MNPSRTSADAAPGPLAGDEHAEQAPVGNGAARGDRQPLGAAASGEGVGGTIPHQPRPQLGERLGRVAAGQHVEHRLEHTAGQAGERCRPPHELPWPELRAAIEAVAKEG